MKICSLKYYLVLILFHPLLISSTLAFKLPALISPAWISFSFASSPFGSCAISISFSISISIFPLVAFHSSALTSSCHHLRKQASL